AKLDIFQPDLILLDVMMPGMDGIQVCQRLKAMPKWRTVPIVIVTALTSKRDMAQCLDAGADDFISKPLNHLELSARVRSMLRIREFNVNLEDQVNRRTAQLMAANLALEQQIKERLLAEEALHLSESRFRALIENSSDLILLLDSQNWVRYASPSIMRNLGYLPDDFMNRPLNLWIHPQDQRQTMYLLEDALANPATSHSVKLRWQHQNGSWSVFETIAQYFTDTTGFSGVAINARDITERLQIEAMERALEHEKELNELKLRFFSMASHEFRTPLSVILMAARILHDNEPDNVVTKRSRNIQRILSSVNTLKLLLSEVLDISRLEAQKMEFKPREVCLKTFCDRILETQQAAHDGKSRIQYTYSGAKTEIRLDPHLLNPILNNLLSNALKYSNADQPVQFHVSLEPRQVEFKISDQGIGIPTANQSHLFETFQRGDNVGSIEGSGLGLAIVKQCVSLHGGQITFKSVQNRGTTFVVRLPIQSPDQRPILDSSPIVMNPSLWREV
ncbi:MAG: ATP-binding protein, partial [Cyanobacteria bacterium J06626_18]